MISKIGLCCFEPLIGIDGLHIDDSTDTTLHITMNSITTSAVGITTLRCEQVEGCFLVFS
jgi:hypothetical protein